jgi:uncharacterized protein (TIGR03663 family)
MTDVAAHTETAPERPAGGTRRRRGPAGWFAAQEPRELMAWGALIAAALIVRVIGLGDRPFHHDESQDAYFSYLFRQSGDYQYNPLLHGPLRFYATGLMYVLFGDSNFTARLAPVLFGLAMIPTCWPLRRLLGRPAAFMAAALFAFGPSYLYFSRFAREDIYVAAITLGLVVAIWCYIDRPRKYHPAIIGALLAASFATKETTFITVFVMGSFFLFSFMVEGWRRQLVHALRRAGFEGWGWFLAAFAGLFTLLFTTFLTHPGGLWDGVYTGLKYWLDQHGVARGGEPAVFYTVVLTTIEWPALIFGAIGAVALWRRGQGYFAAFLIWDFVVSLAVYSWAGEKFAWLVLHPLLPVILLAGVGLQAIWQTRGALRWVGLVVGQRRPQRQPARDARLDPVLDPGQGRRRPGPRARREPRPGRAAAERDGRLRRRRDVPLRLVLPPPPDRLHRPAAGQRRAADDRCDRDDRRGPGEARSGAHRLRGPPVRLPRLVGARVRPDPPREPAHVHLDPQGLEPHGRDEGMALREEGALAQLPDGRPA